MIETLLFTLLSPLLSGRLYPDAAPAGVPYPYGVYQEVIGMPENSLSDGVLIERSLIQITVWDITSLGAKTIGETIASTIATAVTAGTLSGIPISRRGVYEADTALHGMLYEYSVWYH